MVKLSVFFLFFAATLTLVFADDTPRVMLYGEEEAMLRYARCFYPINSGECRDSIEKYAYDSDLGKCKTFTYGGCGAPDENRFDTLSECEKNCATPVDFN